MKPNFTNRIDSNIFRSLIEKITFVIAILSITSLSAQNSNCDATLVVEKERNVRSTTSQGTFYSMVLTNNSNTTSTFTFSSQNLNNNCTNPDNSTTSSNVVLGTIFLNKKQVPITSLTLTAGQKADFFVKIVVPNNLPVNRWSCTQINALSNNCTTSSINTIIHTLIIDSQGE